MRFSLFLFSLAALTLARGAPLERDLGGGLLYYRARNVPGDLPANAIVGTAKHSYVLDLRYAQSDSGGADALAAWLKNRANARTPVFILANAETDRALLSLLSRHDPNEGVLLLGSPAAGFAPDIAIKTTPDAERRAYEAFETQGDPLAVLKENSSKVRNDEAKLSREHLPAPAAEETPADPPLAEEKTAVAPPATPPAAPVDYVLQRAFHLHRALVALKKI
jgi:hypothetical protein